MGRQGTLCCPAPGGARNSGLLPALPLVVDGPTPHATAWDMAHSNQFWALQKSLDAVQINLSVASSSPQPALTKDVPDPVFVPELLNETIAGEVPGAISTPQDSVCQAGTSAQEPTELVVEPACVEVVTEEAVVAERATQELTQAENLPEEPIPTSPMRHQ